jgi:hypothetical protein
MKHIFYILLSSLSVHAQIEKLTVETYYVSDANDATDTIDGSNRALEAGSKTYRVYVDLKPGYKIKKIYGDVNHPLKITSTANFYNNVDRPNAYFGYLINKSWFSSNPTIALDSWLTLGLATKVQNGVLKTEDTNGSTIGGTNNYGGTTSIANGLLINNDAVAGIPLTTEDGLLTNTATLTQWIDNGFRDFSGADTTVFGATNIGNKFISTNAYLTQSTGVSGASTDSNKVLVAQLTTKGTISLELNLELLDSAGNTLKYVANGATLLSDEKVSSFLTYPIVCGCRDMNYLEYSNAYGCSNPTACINIISYGCMDTLACNYDPLANKNLQSLCCYPGYCNNRDISLVCPGISNTIQFDIYPNPAQNQLTVDFKVGGENKEVTYSIFDSYGTLMLQKNMGMLSSSISQSIDISNFQTGLYMMKVSIGADVNLSKRFMKN